MKIFPIVLFLFTIGYVVSDSMETTKKSKFFTPSRDILMQFEFEKEPGYFVTSFERKNTVGVSISVDRNKKEMCFMLSRLITNSEKFMEWFNKLSMGMDNNDPNHRYNEFASITTNVVRYPEKTTYNREGAGLIITYCREYKKEDALLSFVMRVYEETKDAHAYSLLNLNKEMLRYAVEHMFPNYVN